MFDIIYVLCQQPLSGSQFNLSNFFHSQKQGNFVNLLTFDGL
jgi:hypothetical protein